ncbi:hypothetical protein KA107_01210 [Candidatus Pacearchaeota archaeon]|nr:hypothetical protein [Candidatus Pacearchaeota archaeon]
MENAYQIPMYRSPSIAILALNGPACRDSFETPYAKVERIREDPKHSRNTGRKDLVKRV